VKPVRVLLGDRSYDVRFGPIASGLAPALSALGFAGRKALIVTTRSVRRSGHVASVSAALKKANIGSVVVELADGESQKTLATLEKIYRAGFRFGLDRKSLVVAVGGGVVTDLAGFFASTYMRGLAYVSVPTTLLAMVDAAIGGKTGVDTAEGKNLVGTFWQPRLVWQDPSVLRTLPNRQWRTGFAEVAKYGVIYDSKFFAWLEERVSRQPRMSAWTPADVLKALYRSAEIKAAVVSADEKETPLGGGREILNFGHTAGHALEAATGYASLSHGEAISIGMAVAGGLAIERKLWSSADQARVLTLLAAAGLPVRFPRLSAAQRARFWDALKRDKKNVDSRLRFVLPTSVGRVLVQSGIEAADVRRVAVRHGF